MAIALAQSATQVDVSNSSATAATITINGTVGGNALVALASIWNSNNTWTVTNTTDGGNTFVTYAATANRNPDMSRAVVATAVNITGGARTVSVNLSGLAAGANLSYCIGCLEFSGVPTSSSEDTHAINSDIDTSGAVDASAGPFTTTNTADLIVGAASIDCIDTTLNFASPTSWTNSYRQNDSNAFIGFDAGYWLPGALQTSYMAQWSHDNNAGDKAGGVAVALLPASAADPIGSANITSSAGRFIGWTT